MDSPDSFVIPPSEGTLNTIGPFQIRTRLTGSQTAGQFELYDLLMGPGTIDYHVHDKMDETLCVLDGEVEFVVDGKKFPGPTGAVAFVKMGVHHGFTNHGPGMARVLVHFNPPLQQQEYFQGLQELFSAPVLDGEAVVALQKKYDQTLIPAP